VVLVTPYELPLIKAALNVMPKRQILLMLAIGLMFLGFLASNGGQAHAQNISTPLWRYDAPGKLNFIEIADVNGDGIDEVLAVSDDFNLMLLGADGEPQWSSPYRANELITGLAVADFSETESEGRDIALSTETQLLLLNQDGQERWRRSLGSFSSDLVIAYTKEGSTADIVVALENGELQRFTGNGQLVWSYLSSIPLLENPSPKILTADLDFEGSSEIIFSFITSEGFGQLVLIDSDGKTLWEKPTNGTVDLIESVAFDGSRSQDIAVATSLNRIYLYDMNGQLQWPYRSPNKEITALSFVQLEQGPALIVGTSTGTILAYDAEGRKYWSGQYSNTSDRAILAVSSTDESSAPDALNVGTVLGSDPDENFSPQVILLDGSGRRLKPPIETSDNIGLSRLVDLNHDGRTELLLAGFATVELIDPGIGVRQYSPAWDYRIDAEPESAIVADINLDGEQELLVGTADGRIHALAQDGSSLWIADIGDTITQIALAEGAPETLPRIAVIHNDFTPEPDLNRDNEGWLTLLRPDGRILWTEPSPTILSTLTTGDINNNGTPEIIVGTADGLVTAYSLDGHQFWQASINASVNQLMLIEGSRGTEVLIGSGANTIERLNNKGAGPIRTARYLEDITNLDKGPVIDNPVQMIFVSLEDESIRALNPRGSQIWSVGLDGIPQVTTSADNSLLIGTDEQTLTKVGSNGEILWQLADMGRITDIYWGDLDGDVKSDVAVGNREGLIRLIDGEGTNTWEVLNAASELFFLSGLKGLPQENSDLVSVTDNGVVTLYRSQANHPPFLINPEVEVGQGSYGISVTAIDVDSDPVIVTLEIYDHENGRWIDFGDRQLSGESGTLFWQVDPPPDSPEVRYRFEYNDGLHIGVVEPTVGPAPLEPSAFNAATVAIMLVVVGSTVGAVLFVRQTRTQSSRVNRFYKQVVDKPAETLRLLDREYERTKGSPDFLLSIAGTARHLDDVVLANLADGLYLVAARPDSALPIILSALEEAEALEPRWWTLSQWLIVFKLGQSLLVAPSITELSLLRPQFEESLETLKKVDRNVEVFDAMRPVLTSLRDGERVDLAQDRLVYLNECSSLLEQIQIHSVDWPVRVDNTLALGIANRWIGLVKAEIEDIKGRAQLEISLLTKNVISDDNTIVALEIKNIGRSPARVLTIDLEDSPAYKQQTMSQTIPLLSPGNSRQVQFSIEPLLEDPFRLLFSVTYLDRHQQPRETAFADRINPIKPLEDFKEVINPYSPGMPLRPNSSVFFGREDLFSFVRDNSSQLSQRKVLIFVGQRRTGKTSALLQLHHHLPSEIVPAYIDCQSLGVTPGMAALLHDIAWSISDTLATRKYSLPVPELSYWNDDPAGIFQRQFLPSVRDLLPADTNLLLIFDEFEAFQNLVDDNILPPTFFTFLRHLMQHETGLSFIFAGTHKLEEIGSDYWSVLFNIALYRHVGFLSQEAAERLIRDPVDPQIVFDDLAVAKILRVTAGHPYFLQLVCYTLVNRANSQKKGYVTISDVNAGVNEMLRLGEVHFAYIWQRSSYIERALLVAAANLMSANIPFMPVDLVQYLEKFSIKIDPADVTMGLDNLVEREIFQEIQNQSKSLFALRIGLVGIWVAQNKNLSRLHNKSTPAANYRRNKVSNP